ncbi:unnamed protein product, partial [Meganyctiphanes norvegica]
FGYEYKGWMKSPIFEKEKLEKNENTFIYSSYENQDNHEPEISNYNSIDEGISPTPYSKKASLDKTKNWDITCKAKVNQAIPFTQYHSTRTGLKITLVETEGPLVEGRFVIATEPADDNGLAHCLEHLIFAGSEDYPYRGTLPLIATRCLARNLNAAT